MPNERDAEYAVQLLGDASIRCTPCPDLPTLCTELRVGAGALLLTDEVLVADTDGLLEAALREQPAWSALPVLVLARERASERLQLGAIAAYKSVVIVERPVRSRSLISAVHSALRARRNQYDVRDAIRERERQAEELRVQDDHLRFALSAGRLGSWEIDLTTNELSCSDTC